MADQTDVVVEAAVVADDELLVALTRLLPQLSSAPPPTAYELETLVDSQAITLLVARVEGRIVGSLTLVLFRVPTGQRAWIEDVVVDEAARGHGVGAALVDEALRLAQRAGARTVDLTSRATREAANRRYVRLGFTRRETNLYRFTLPGAG